MPYLGGSHSIALIAVAVAIFGSSLAIAQEFPNRPIRMIVPLSTGSTVDYVARRLTAPLSEALKQQIVVDNRPGAGGVTGTEMLVRAPKDGYTIGMTSSNHVINPGIYQTMPFDSIKDITPISILATVPLVLVTTPKLPAKNLADLVALAKAKPGVLNYGSAGSGSVLHLAGVLFVNEAGVQINHVPYRGSGPLTNDLVGGHVEMGFLSVTVALGQIQGGGLHPIAVSTSQRFAQLPDVPTFSESGLPNYSFDAWIALIGPADLPAPIVSRLHAAAKASLASADVQKDFAVQGLSIISNDPQTAAKFFETELTKHSALVKQSGAKQE
jgi:tripartite-type tricarboxylate transporter receptor subunit TctC